MRFRFAVVKASGERHGGGEGIDMFGDGGGSFHRGSFHHGRCCVTMGTKQNQKVIEVETR